MWIYSTTGQSQLLQINQGLGMQHILDHSLANPNQCQSFDVSWCDDVWDKHQSLGIKCENPDLSTIFKMKGSTALFTTRTPIED